MSARKLHPVVIEWLAVELLVALLRGGLGAWVKTRTPVLVLRTSNELPR